MRKFPFLLAASTFVLASCGETNTETVEAESTETEAIETETAEPEKKERVNKALTEEATIDAGLPVGSEAPLKVSLKSKDGEATLESTLSNDPAILIFTRSVEWCPFCQTQLKSINAIVGELEDRGYKLFGVSYDSADAQYRFSQNQMLQYGMLSDENSELIDAFGLRDPQYTEGRAEGVPYAAVIVIGSDGKIIKKSVSSDFKMRPTNDQILTLVDSI